VATFYNSRLGFSSFVIFEALLHLAAKGYIERKTLSIAMNTNVQKVRKDYAKQELTREDLPNNPVVLLEEWLSAAESTDPDDYNAMCLSSVDETGKPSSRIVLLRSITDQGIRFFTNYESKKGRDIAVNENVCVNFFWRDWERQVRITGVASKCAPKVSDEYFASRPRASQIGAWTSHQSRSNVEPIIQERVKDAIESFKDADVIPRPDFWGGYDLSIEAIEFWQGRPSRLHNRWRYRIKNQSGGAWNVDLLDP
jgi:pyridoxamine 5'-phosphate oxidase